MTIEPQSSSSRVDPIADVTQNLEIRKGIAELGNKNSKMELERSEGEEILDFRDFNRKFWFICSV